MTLQETYKDLNRLNLEHLTDRETLKLNRVIYSLLSIDALINHLIDKDNIILMYQAFNRSELNR